MRDDFFRTPRRESLFGRFRGAQSSSGGNLYLDILMQKGGGGLTKVSSILQSGDHLFDKGCSFSGLVVDQRKKEIDWRLGGRTVQFREFKGGYYGRPVTTNRHLISTKPPGYQVTISTFLDLDVAVLKAPGRQN